MGSYRLYNLRLSLTNGNDFVTKDGLLATNVKIFGLNVSWVAAMAGTVEKSPANPTYLILQEVKIL